MAVWQRGQFDGQSVATQNVTQPGIHARPSSGRTLRLFHPKLNKSSVVGTFCIYNSAFDWVVEFPGGVQSTAFPQIVSSLE